MSHYSWVLKGAPLPDQPADAASFGGGGFQAGSPQAFNPLVSLLPFKAFDAPSAPHLS